MEATRPRASEVTVSVMPPIRFSSASSRSANSNSARLLQTPGLDPQLRQPPVALDQFLPGFFVVAGLDGEPLGLGVTRRERLGG